MILRYSYGIELDKCLHCGPFSGDLETSGTKAAWISNCRQSGQLSSPKAN